jgi:hypothetical protein
MRSRWIACLAIGASAVLASNLGVVAQTSPVRGIWLTDREMPPGGMFSGPAEYFFGPAQEEVAVEKGSGRPIKLVIAFWGGNAHDIAVRRVAPDGKETTTKWSVSTVPRSKANNWRVTYKHWEMDRLVVGEHTFHVTIDGASAGSYKASIR